jgi:signal transduction histidine kinase
MSLAGRFTFLVLGILALVLAGLASAVQIGAWTHLDRQVRDRSSAALAVLEAAAEIHPDGVEWEPRERLLSVGQEGGANRLRWMVFDAQGRRIDASPNLGEAELTAWVPHLDRSESLVRVGGRRGGAWHVTQRRLAPERLPASRGSALRGEAGPAETDASIHPALILAVFAPLGPMERTLARLGWFLGTVSLGLWLAAALACRRLSRRALRPLHAMVRSARDLDATDTGWRLELPGTGDELDELGRAFNDLLMRLRTAYERQRRFSGDASHQLRTPLTVLIGQLEVALRQERTVDEYRRVLRTALGRALHLGRIVEALLFLARAEAEAGLPPGESIELNAWLQGQLVEATPPEFALHTGGDPLWVRIHPPLLEQLLANLLENARTHGRSEGPISVESYPDGDGAVLAVEDRGPGIAPEDLPRVFEPFYRRESASSKARAGVGLGLAIVQRIATAYGGTVEVRSEVGRGCRFEVRLPREPEDQRARPASARSEDAERLVEDRGVRAVMAWPHPQGDDIAVP